MVGKANSTTEAVSTMFRFVVQAVIRGKLTLLHISGSQSLTFKPATSIWPNITTISLTRLGKMATVGEDVRSYSISFVIYLLKSPAPVFWSAARDYKNAIVSVSFSPLLEQALTNSTIRPMSFSLLLLVISLTSPKTAATLIMPETVGPFFFSVSFRQSDRELAWNWLKNTRMRGDNGRESLFIKFRQLHNLSSS